MRKIIVSEDLSLDGVIEAPENWVFPFQNAEMMQAGLAQLQDLDALLFGRVTYDIFASYWPNTAGQGNPVADLLNHLPKYVVSSTLTNAGWEHSTLIQSNVSEAIRELKQQPGGNIGVTGSATLVQSLLRDGLIDEFQLMLFPIIVGSGKQLFPAGLGCTEMKLVSCRSFDTGAVLLTYQPQQNA